MLLFKRENRRILLLVSFFGYLFLLTYFMFFAESFGRTPGHHGCNLMPFQEIKRYMHHWDALGVVAWINLAGNVFAFFPFGFFVPALLQDYTSKRMGVIATFVSTALFSLLLEVVQLLTNLGSFDVDDIILNSIGGIFGYLLYRLAKYGMRRIYHGWKKSHSAS